VEPFGGSGSVLFCKGRSEVEVYNDLDGEICNLMRVVRDNGQELAEKIYFTPYSREEFIGAFNPSEDPVEQARRTIVRAYQGWGSSYGTYTRKSKCGTPFNSFRIGWRVKGNRPNELWTSVSDTIMGAVERIRGVVIENASYKTVIEKNDTDETLVYADPPYVPDSRDKGNDYRYECTVEDHVELSRVLHNCKGPVVLSGYHSELYNDLYHDWQVAERKARTAGNTDRTEVLWIKGGAPGLFD
jgi:DNA adenine methylase